MAERIASTAAVPFPYDPARTAVAQMYLEPGMIADRVLPSTPELGTDRLEWLDYEIDDAFQVPDTRLGRRGEPTLVEFVGAEVVDRTEHHGLRDVVPAEDRDAAMAGPMRGPGRPDPVDTANLYLTHLMHLDRETRTANLVFDTDSYKVGYKAALGLGARFTDDAADVLKTLETALTTPIFRPNVVVFGQEPWSAFRQHPQVLKATNRVSGADSGLATRMAVAELLEVDEVLVGRSRIGSSVEGQALALKRAWGKSVACIYRGAYGEMTPSGMPGSERQEMSRDMPMTADMKRPTFGFRAVYREMYTHTGFNERIGVAGATELAVRDSCKEVIAGSEFGYLISTAVA